MPDYRQVAAEGLPLAPKARSWGMADSRPSMAGNPQITPDLADKVLPGSFPGDLGIRLVSIADDEVRGRLEVDRRHLHPGGYVHGGVWVALADTVAAWGTMRNLPAEHGFTTAELKANVFAAGQEGDVLEAVGRSPVLACVAFAPAR